MAGVRSRGACRGLRRIRVQVNGKVRARIKLPKSMEQKDIVDAALALNDVKPFVEGKTIRKTIVVKNIINLVVG